MLRRDGAEDSANSEETEMGNRYKGYLDNARETIASKLNMYLAGEGLERITGFVTSAFDLGNERMIAVYPASPSGETFKDDGHAAHADLTIEIYLNEDATAESCDLAEKYYTALIGFLQEVSFSEFDVISTSSLLRMDDGFDRNGAMFLIESRLSTLMDWGY